MASLPLPPHLIPKPPSNMGRHSLELGISTRQSDPEPWRCKRTDGKKWRCSRDVAPDHKYCERHTRKSRPRSRKPVEFHFDDNTTMNHKPNLQGLIPSSYFPFLPPPAAAAADDSIPYETPRNLEWVVKGEANAVPSDYYYMRKDDKDSIFELDHHREQQPTFPSTPYQCEWLGNDDHYNTWFCSLPKSTTSSTDAATATALSPGGLAQGQETRHFLDAWSTTAHSEKNYITRLDRKKSSPVSSADKATLPLTLSMCGGGGGSTETSYEVVEGTSLRTQWLSHGSWPMSSPPGGPLAEALCLGIPSSRSKSPPNLTSGINSSFPDKW